MSRNPHASALRHFKPKRIEARRVFDRCRKDRAFQEAYKALEGEFSRDA